MSKVRIGIVGTGGIARNRHIPCFKANADVELVAASDPVASSLQEVGEKFDIPQLYADYEEMFAKAALDGVVICTPNKFHAPASISALNSGIHVLCEKPMALDPAEGRAMIAAATTANKILTIGFHYRHRTPVKAAKQIIDSGELGHVYMVRVNALRRRGIPSWGSFVHKHIQGGGAMIDFGVHTLDSALYLLGNPKPIEVSATLSQHLGTRPNVNPWGQWNYKEFTVEDQVAAFVRFDNGASMLLECSWALNVPETKETISLSGTEAGLDVFPLKVNKAQYGMLTHWVPDWMEKENEEPGIGQAADFVNAIKNGGQPNVTAAQALQVTDIVDAIYRSAESGQAIRLA
jgi:predicted dehydrogenase